MRANKLILFFFAFLGMAASAYAEKIITAPGPVAVAMDLPHGPALHADIPTSAAVVTSASITPGFAAYDRSSIQEPMFPSQMQDYRDKALHLNLDSNLGLHWSLAEQRPSLAYQFTDNGVMHFRAGKSSARILAIWVY